MMDSFTHDLYHLTTGELRELALVLTMKKSVRDMARAHMNVMCHTGNPDSRLDATASIISASSMLQETPAMPWPEWNELKQDDLPATSLQPRYVAPAVLEDSLRTHKTEGITKKKSKKISPQALTKKSRIVIPNKRTPLYHECVNCHNRFRQQDNHPEACRHHSGKSHNQDILRLRLLLILANRPAGPLLGRKSGTLAPEEPASAVVELLRDDCEGRGVPGRETCSTNGTSRGVVW